MRLRRPILAPRRPVRSTGLTIPEMMISVTIFSLLTLGFIQAQIFGLRYDAAVQSKLGATDQSRIGLGRLASEIRSGKSFKVGAGEFASFTEAADGSAQQGTSLQIYPDTSTNTYIRYYLDTTSKELRRMENGGTSFSVIAESLTNSVIFTSEDFRGTVLTEVANNSVVGVLLQFYQFKYPLTAVGPGQYYDFYKLQFKVTRRAFD